MATEEVEEGDKKENTGRERGGTGGGPIMDQLVSLHGICGGKIALEQFFLQVLQFFSVRIVFQPAVYTPFQLPLTLYCVIVATCHCR
jgi:hypothetical protein